MSAMRRYLDSCVRTDARDAYRRIAYAIRGERDASLRAEATVARGEWSAEALAGRTSAQKALSVAVARATADDDNYLLPDPPEDWEEVPEAQAYRLAWEEAT